MEKPFENIVCSLKKMFPPCVHKSFKIRFKIQLKFSMSFPFYKMNNARSVTLFTIVLHTCAAMFYTTFYSVFRNVNKFSV